MVKIGTVAIVCNVFPLLLVGRSLCALSFQIACHSQKNRQFDRKRVGVTLLSMVRGQNKQALLRQKLEEAKRQKILEESDGAPTNDQLSAEEIQERNDRLRFEQLLQQGVTSTSDSYLRFESEDDLLAASEYRADRLYDGDLVNAEPFEDLVSVKTGTAIGPIGMKQLLPWLQSNQNVQKQLIVLCDPRPKSFELREAVKNLMMSLPTVLKNTMIVVNADTPSENRRWIKKNRYDESLNVMSDEKMTWMRSYTALGKDRWSMTLFVLKDGRVKRIVRELDHCSVSRTIIDAVRSPDELRLN